MSTWTSWATCQLPTWTSWTTCQLTSGYVEQRFNLDILNNMSTDNLDTWNNMSIKKKCQTTTASVWDGASQQHPSTRQLRSTTRTLTTIETIIKIIFSQIIQRWWHSLFSSRIWISIFPFITRQRRLVSSIFKLKCNHFYIWKYRQCKSKPQKINKSKE